MKLLREAARAATIVWTLLRHRVPGALYRDVVRSHLSNPHCPCEADTEMTARARRMRHALERLGPAFVKLGQFLSRRPDLLPGPYLTELSALQERTPPVPFEAARRTLESVCICPSGHADQDHHEGARGHSHDPLSACLHCRGLEGVFDRFELEPVASASLAQVHRAVYRGRPVAVKFLKPGVLDLLNRDLDLLRRLRWMTGRLLGLGRNIDPEELVEEFARRLREEVNLENEALNVERFRDGHPDDGEVRAPRVFWEFRRADVLVMDFAEGPSLRTWRGTPAERARLAERLCRDFVRQVFVQNLFHADPHPGNLLVGEDGRVTYLDFGTVGRLDAKTRRGLLLLLRAILEDDAELAVSAVLGLGGTGPTAVDRAQLVADVDRIIQLYRRRAGMHWTDEVVAVARRHRIRLPRSILLYAKATVLIESLVTELDPDFEVLSVLTAAVGPVLRREMEDRWTELRRTLPELAATYAELARRLPHLIERFLDDDEDGIPPGGVIRRARTHRATARPVSGSSFRAARNTT